MNPAEGRRARPPQIPGGGHPGWHRARPAGHPAASARRGGGAAGLRRHGSPLFEGADAAQAAVDLFVDEGLLVEEAVDDHDMLKHYENGADLVQDWPARRGRPAAETASFLKSIVSECIVRERCRLRRLRRGRPRGWLAGWPARGTLPS